MSESAAKSASSLSARHIEVAARGADNQLLPGANFRFESAGTLLGTADATDGHASIELDSRDIPITVSVAYGSETKSCSLAADQDEWTFRFSDRSSNFLRSHFPAFLGCGLFAIALVLAFAVPTQTSLQTRLILAFASLGGGLIATEIPGLLHAKVSVGEKVAIVAGGAIAVFVILYLTVPAGQSGA